MKGVMRTRLFDISRNSSTHKIFMDMLKLEDWGVEEILEEYSICSDDLLFSYVTDDSSPNSIYEFQSSIMISNMIKEVNNGCDLQIIFRIDFETMVLDGHMIYVEYANIVKESVSRTLLFGMNAYKKELTLSASENDLRKYQLLLCLNTEFLVDNYKTDTYGNNYMEQNNTIYYIGLCKPNEMTNDKSCGVVSFQLYGKNSTMMKIDFLENMLYIDIDVPYKKQSSRLLISLHATSIPYLEKVKCNRKLKSTCEMLVELEKNAKVLIDNYESECKKFDFAQKEYINFKSSQPKPTAWLFGNGYYSKIK
jgi:hypothetical protein